MVSGDRSWCRGITRYNEVDVFRCLTVGGGRCGLARNRSLGVEVYCSSSGVSQRGSEAIALHLSGIWLHKQVEVEGWLGVLLGAVFGCNGEGMPVQFAALITRNSTRCHGNSDLSWWIIRCE